MAPVPTTSSAHRSGRDPGRRERILEVARRHFTERGFVGTRLDDIAAEAGCAKGAIYLEFDDKVTLLREVLQQTFSRVGERFEQEVMVLPSPLARLRETLRFAYRQHSAEPLFGRLLRDDPELRVLRGDQDEAWRTAAAERGAMIAGWVDEGIRRGEIRPDVDPDVIPRVLGLLRLAPQHLALVTGDGRTSGERVLEAVVDIFVAGLASAPAAAAPARRLEQGRPRRRVNGTSAGRPA